MKFYDETTILTEKQLEYLKKIKIPKWVKRQHTPARKWLEEVEFDPKFWNAAKKTNKTKRL